MSLVKLDTNCEKEVSTVKINNVYHGIVVGDDGLYLTTDTFESPLKAANAARKLKRENKIVRTVKKKSISPYNQIKTKIIRVDKLYTEAEVAALTHLRFREAWVIMSPQGRYVKNMLKNNKVVEYCSDRETALKFNTYEDASTGQKTLNNVVLNGHYLRRFFIEKNEK